MAIRFLRHKFNLVTNVSKVLGSRIHCRRESVQVARNTGGPQPFLIGIHHQMPETALLRCRSRGFHKAFSRACGLGGLVHFINLFALTSHQQVAIRMVHDTIGTLHVIAFCTKRLLVRRFHQQVTRTIILVADALDAVVLFVLGIVQRSLGSSMRHDIADLLNPNTRRRIFRGRIIYICSIAYRRRQQKH